MILGTAGHIDHGKTSLVRALTGFDTDRLPEEKARGITIDLGFAYWDVAGQRIGVVDVPGHERFIRNMLAGATGIDLALIVVAADDGIMPQTREHLEILRFLDVRHCVVALTKSDLADADTRELVKEHVRELLAGTPLADAAIVETSVVNGTGLSELESALLDAAKSVVAQSTMPFRLAVDRVFVKQGHGTVITGTVQSGTLAVGDEIDWHHDGAVERVRVRGLARHGDTVERVERGQRAAVNLAGVPHEAIRRGHELAAPAFLTASRLLTVKLTASRDGRAIRHRLPVRVHLGTAEVMGTVALLGMDSLSPGAEAFAQLFLEEPVTAMWGQAFVVRDSGAEATLGGGIIVQPVAGKIKRTDATAVEYLQRLTSSHAVERVTAACWFAKFEGLHQEQLPKLCGVTHWHDDHALVRLGNVASAVFHGDCVQALEARLVETLARAHRSQPLATDHDRHRVLAEMPFEGDRNVLERVLDHIVARGTILARRDRITLASFKPKLNANQLKWKDQIVAAFRTAGLNPPDLASLAPAGQAKPLAELIDVAVAEGLLVKISADVILHAVHVEAVVNAVRGKLTASGATVATIRDWLGTTRKYAVPICEYLDRTGVTFRKGDYRFLKPD